MRIRFSPIPFCLLLLCSSPAIPAQNQVTGRELYSQLCAACHGTDLNGANGPSLLDAEWKYGPERSKKVAVTKLGLIDQGMPPFGEALTDAQINQIFDYLDDANPAQASTPVQAETLDSLDTLDYKVKVEVWVKDLQIPWALDFIDARRALVTERPGRLRIVEDGRLLPEPVAGTPEVLHEGQGGLMDVAVDPDYARTGWIYLAYSHALPAKPSEKRPGAMTRIVRGKIRENQWVEQQVLFEAPHDLYRTTRHHYGCRIVFDPQGNLYFSIGDRGMGDEAQDLGHPNGKVHRIHRDGSIPADNPFLSDPKALPSIFSYGHRNPQGLAVHPVTGALWDAEHGPMGGDELNRLEAGKNYGWPVITYGLNYNNTIITEERRRPGMESPNLYWRPSIAVCGIDFYRGDLFPRWRNHLLAGALAYQEVRLLDIEDDRIMHDEVILKGAGRVRDVGGGPDGAIYVVQNQPDRILRLTPEAVKPISQTEK